MSGSSDIVFPHSVAVVLIGFPPKYRCDSDDGSLPGSAVRALLSRSRTCNWFEANCGTLPESLVERGGG
eukprot:COSAG01_NODE_57091_length_314_cov_1.181395_1_plen_68_part_01